MCVSSLFPFAFLKSFMRTRTMMVMGLCGAGYWAISTGAGGAGGAAGTAGTEGVGGAGDDRTSGMVGGGGGGGSGGGVGASRTGGEGRATGGTNELY